MLTAAYNVFLLYESKYELMNCFIAKRHAFTKDNDPFSFLFGYRIVFIIYTYIWNSKQVEVKHAWKEMREKDKTMQNLCDYKLHHHIIVHILLHTQNTPFKAS